MVSAESDRTARFEAVAAAVYEPLQRYLGRRAAPDDVSELLNDVLIVIWRRLDDVPGDDIRAWSYGVAKRCLANHRRSGERRLRLVDRLGSRLPAPDLGGDSAHDGDRPALMIALDALDETERELVRLWAWEELEPREIAIVLDTTANAVSSKLLRTRKKLAVLMERQSIGLSGHEVCGHRKETRS